MQEERDYYDPDDYREWATSRVQVWKDASIPGGFDAEGRALYKGGDMFAGYWKDLRHIVDSVEHGTMNYAEAMARQDALLCAAHELIELYAARGVDLPGASEQDA